MFSYLYKVSSKLIGDERYSVLDITKKSSLNYRNILNEPTDRKVNSLIENTNWDKNLEIFKFIFRDIPMYRTVLNS